MTTLEAIEKASKFSAKAWFANYAHIWTKDGQLTGNKPGDANPPLKLNKMQRELDDIILWCRENNEPCKIVGCKGRQSGLSTGSVKNAYHKAVRKTSRVCIIGDEYEKSVKNLVRMFETYSREDKCPWNVTYNAPGKVFSNGSELVTETANDPRGGASGTFQVIVATEVAHWPETGVRSARQTLAALLNCVPPASVATDTLVILESTPKGASGAFYDTFQGAVTFDEFKAGKRGNGFIKIFYAWHEHDDYRSPCTPAEAVEIMGSLTEREHELIRRHSLPVERLKWRRDMIKSPNFSGDEDLFDQEYPPDPESGFLSSGRMAFPAAALDQIETIGRKWNPLIGVLERGRPGTAQGINFRPTPDVESWVKIYERPKLGCRYIIGADPATGIERASGEGADHHGVPVLRVGQHVAGQGWVPPMVVAVITSTKDRPCRVAIDVLAEWIDIMSRYYGRCPVAFEVNNSGLALYQCLKTLETPIYQRKVNNFKEGTSELKPGWVTDEKTRTWMIGVLQSHIRQLDETGFGLICPCQDIQKELRKFILNPRGRFEAARGAHDDGVFGLGIALVLENYATPFREEVVTHPVGGDLKRLDALRQARASNGQGRRAFG